MSRYEPSSLRSITSGIDYTIIEQAIPVYNETILLGLLDILKTIAMKELLRKIWV